MKWSRDSRIAFAAGASLVGLFWWVANCLNLAQREIHEVLTYQSGRLAGFVEMSRKMDELSKDEAKRR